MAKNRRLPRKAPQTPILPVVGIGASAGGLEAFTRFAESAATGHGDGLCVGSAHGPNA